MDLEATRLGNPGADERHINIVSDVHAIVMHCDCDSRLRGRKTHCEARAATVVSLSFLLRRVCVDPAFSSIVVEIRFSTFSRPRTRDAGSSDSPPRKTNRVDMNCTSSQTKVDHALSVGGAYVRGIPVQMQVSYNDVQESSDQGCSFNALFLGFHCTIIKPLNAAGA